MITGAQTMACGNCGCGQFRVYKSSKTIHVECVKCLSVSDLIVSTPKIDIEWGENSDGILSEMTPMEDR
jgi:hypothetical protein